MKKFLNSFLPILCLIAVSLVVGCGGEEAKEIKRLEEKIAAIERQRDIDLSHRYEENSPEYHKDESMYAHELAYLRVRKKSFQALRGDVSAYPIAKQYFETYIAFYSDRIKEDEGAIAGNGEHTDFLKWSLKENKEAKGEFEGYLERLERIHSQ